MSEELVLATYRGWKIKRVSAGWRVMDEAGVPLNEPLLMLEECLALIDNWESDLS